MSDSKIKPGMRCNIIAAPIGDSDDERYRHILFSRCTVKSYAGPVVIGEENGMIKILDDAWQVILDNGSLGFISTPFLQPTAEPPDDLVDRFQAHQRATLSLVD